MQGSVIILTLDPGSEKIRIRDKHLGSATLPMVPIFQTFVMQSRCRVRPRANPFCIPSCLVKNHVQ
jgi:hypothetical protein